MSIAKTTYVIYGYKLPYKMLDSNGDEIDFWNEKFLPIVEGWKGEPYSMIADGMSGEYRYFGQVLVEIDEFESKELDLSTLNPESIQKRFKELFGNQKESYKLSLFVFNHYY